MAQHNFELRVYPSDGRDFVRFIETREEGLRRFASFAELRGDAASEYDSVALYDVSAAAENRIAHKDFHA